MSADLTITKVNEVYLRVDCDPHIQYELRDAFCFEVPGAKFHPSYRKSSGMEIFTYSPHKQDNSMLVF